MPDGRKRPALNLVLHHMVWHENLWCGVSKTFDSVWGEWTLLSFKMSRSDLNWKSSFFNETDLKILFKLMPASPWCFVFGLGSILPCFVLFYSLKVCHKVDEGIEGWILPVAVLTFWACCVVTGRSHMLPCNRIPSPTKRSGVTLPVSCLR